ncbi:uncharacterized protein TRAVEDRAFT_166094 [Trametes versicolor FP-101664 SS1]|uniref:uncharacterized protein n=1 Tax=Trametes versicolor (strain FP-101664) TaxID=717944 RepID=UPI000462458A|nr:uncharacterized protein TRAVEDRAFT_166094 [Trametes versicolor FP-101664 SS1]EIW60959.1 hypothetical protein TRAVEDRAFT_166094 [Trametes versicolor FP-101664 SS1]
MPFERDTTALLADEFRRLSLDSGWGKKSAKFKKERAKFYGGAVAQDFTTFWGSNASRLDAWQDLCRHLGITDVPSSIKKCKLALKPFYVNLVDLVDSKRQGIKPRIFSSESELAGYIQKTSKIFPKAQAKTNPLLRQFLIVVFG